MGLMMALASFGGEAVVRSALALWKPFSNAEKLAAAVRRLEQTGRVTLSGSGPLDTRILRWTEQGRCLVSAGVDPPSRWERPWDGAWRIVAFDIPERDLAVRARLRRRLHELRFGWLQNSVWISPDPVESFGERLGGADVLPDSLSVFEAKPVGGESAAGLVRSAWDFEAIEKGYGAYREILAHRPVARGRRERWVQWLGVEQRAWRRVAELDPFLPRVLLPDGYSGEAVWRQRLDAFAALRRLIE